MQGFCAEGIQVTFQNKNQYCPFIGIACEKFTVYVTGIVVGEF